MKSRLLAASLACAALAACGRQPAPARRSQVRVAAAADLNQVLPDIITRFSASHAVDVSVSYGSSGTLYNQLVNGAPFDIFFSADTRYPQLLADRGLTLSGSDFTYAIGRLVLWVSSSSTLDIAKDGLKALAQPAVARIAIANPDHAPYGRAAVAALRSAGVYDAVAPKLALGENVAQALQFVQSGAAQAGLVAKSLALAPAARETGRWVEIAPNDYPRLEQGGVVMKATPDSDAARAFRAFVVTGEGRAILQQYGFTLPEL